MQPVRTFGFLARGFMVFVLGAVGILRSTAAYEMYDFEDEEGEDTVGIY